jgi:hypothetical protein
MAARRLFQVSGCPGPIEAILVGAMRTSRRDRSKGDIPASLQAVAKVCSQSASQGNCRGCARRRAAEHALGRVTINDWAWHAINHDAPFGGIGNSGMGIYHGVEGFRELSHARSVFKRHRVVPIRLFYPSYGNLLQRLALKWFIGQADSSARGLSPFTSAVCPSSDRRGDEDEVNSGHGEQGRRRPARTRLSQPARSR